MTWNLDDPEAVFRAHREYVAAGAGVLLTNTFGASRDRLGAGDRVESINRAGVRIARRASAPETLVAGDIGPCRGDAAEQAAWLLSEGVDLLFLETFIDSLELRESVAACRSVRADVPLAASMTFATEPDLSEVAARAAELERLDVDWIGVNCLSPDEMEPIVAGIASASRAPIVARPSAGLPSGDPPVYPIDIEALAGGSLSLVRAGARIIGGCCGTTPLFIERLGRELR